MRQVDTQTALYKQARIGFALSRAIESAGDLLRLLNEQWQDEPGVTLSGRVDAAADALRLLKHSQP